MSSLSSLETLSERERAVLALIAQGRTNAEIADALDIRYETAKWHVSEIISKLGVGSREEAAREWQQQHRLMRRLSRSMRALLGPAVLKGAVASIVGVAVGGATLAGVIAVRSNGDARVLSAASQASTPTPTPAPMPSRATKDGLALRVARTQIDDVQTTIDVVLEGRPELGRLASPAFGFPGDFRLEDELGNVMPMRQMGGNASEPRSWSFTFDPVSASARVLTLTLSNAAFVDAASSPAVGQRPPDPSATIAGPWVAEIRDFARKTSAQVQVDTTPRAFGPGFVAIDEVRQTDWATVVYAHLVDFPREDIPGLLHLQWELVDQNGLHASTLAGIWGIGPALANIEWQFSPAKGPVTLTLQGSARQTAAGSSPIILSAVGSPPPSDAEKADAIARWGDMAARLKAAFAGTPPAEWKLVLP